MKILTLLSEKIKILLKGPNPGEMNMNVAAWSRLMKRVNTSTSQTPPPHKRNISHDQSHPISSSHRNGTY